MILVEWPREAVEQAHLLQRPKAARDERISAKVAAILCEIEQEGDPAVERWSKEFDACAPNILELCPKRVDEARKALPGEDLAALDFAVEVVTNFHRRNRPLDGDWVEHPKGVFCRKIWRPIATCGLYVPGGGAPLFSSLIMMAQPAAIAGVARRIAVTPPQKGGDPAPIMIAAAAACGLGALYVVGGVQAIGAMGFGVGMPRVEKICGPGNAYVEEAKRQLAARPDGPAIDLPAGPSELMVIMDGQADPHWVAADLLSQAEHDAQAQVMLVSDDPGAIEAVLRALESQLCDLPRAAIARAALANGRAILARDLNVAAEIANAYAPEHLSIQTETPDALADRIESAGAIFLGPNAAEAFGDYAAGPSHVLPTGGAARAYSGISVHTFMKSISVQKATPIGAAEIAPIAARLARLEGLEAHARAADLRKAPL